MKIRWLAACVLAGLAAPFGLALDPQKTITQFVHTSWTEQQGVPSNIRALAQTTDGYLWLGTRTGLFRFDGLRFARFQARAGEDLPTTRIRALLAAHDGALWIVFDSGGVTRLRDGHLTSYAERDGLPAAFGLAERGDGDLIAATTHGLARFQRGIWVDAGKEWHYPGRLAKQVYFDKQGTLWALSGDKVLYLPAGQNRFVDDAEPARYATNFAQASDGSVWIAEAGRSAHMVRRSDDRSPSTEVQVGASWVLVDRNGSLWIGTAGDGLRRVPYPSRINGRQIARFGPEAEQFTVKNGLSGNYVKALLEDREGNIWSATLQGLDRFRESAFAPVTIPDAELSRLITATSDGSLWTAPLNPSGVLRIGRQGPEEVGFRLGANAMCQDATGTVWLFNEYGLYRFQQGRFVKVPLPGEVALKEAAGIASDRSGGIWLLDQEEGLFRFASGALTKITNQPDPLSPWGYLYTDRRGRIWEGQSNRVTLYDRGTSQTFGTREGVPPGPVFTIYQDRAGSIWAGGEGGLSKFEDGRFWALSKPNGFPAHSVFGIAEDDDGYFWIATDAGVLRMPGRELDRAIVDPAYRVRYKSFNMLDGLPAKPRESFPMPVVSRTSDGRIWFATSNGLAFVDPRRIPKNNLPPPLQVEAVKIDGHEAAPTDGMKLGHGINEIEIDYTALSLSIPERVLFRYKLEGTDVDWHDVATRRQAFYNHLAPKRYRFRVIACNNDGLWNEAGASWAFSVAPAFYQTVWFEFLCVLTVCLALALAHRLRVRQIASSMNARFNERLAERTQLARDFHDTLLQTIQGSKMVADDALNHPADPVRMRNTMERLSDWLTQAIDEGRAALTSLRNSTTEQNDLAAALQRAGEECKFQRPIEFRLSVDGASREMHPILRDEVYRIGYEAIRNAFVHSEGNRVSVELSYVEDLILRVFDNGKGIDPAVAARGKGGHFGLPGMYERASRLVGRLKLSSTPGAGTQVELVVPGRIAFLQPEPTNRLRLPKIRWPFRIR